MNKRDWVISLSPLFFTWGIDRITKYWATFITDPHFLGPVGFLLHHNQGAMLGLFSDLPKILRVVSLSTGGAFLLFLFAIIQFLLPSKTILLRVGLSFLIGGIIGNVTDRIVWGYVVDFIVFTVAGRYSPAFNLADALQWVGYVCIVVAFIRDGKSLWPVENLRKNYWIKPKFQLRYCLILMLCGFGLNLIAGTYSYTYLNVSIHELSGGNDVLTRHLLTPFIITFLIISVTFSAVLFVVGMILSHRAAGPLYAFERFLNDQVQGKPSKLRLRTGDDFKELEEVANRLVDKINPVSSRSKSG